MKTLQKVLLILLGFIFALLLAEILLRLFWKPAFLDKRYLRNDLDWISNNVSLNRFGYRDRDFSLKKGDGTFRVYVLGDSYTYGWMLNNVNDSYSKVVEKLLREKYGSEKVDVVNASRPGFNFSDEVGRLKQEGILFSPDLVLVGVNLFDFMTKTYSYYPSSNFFENLRLYQITVGNIKRSQMGRKMVREVASTYSDSSPEMEKVKKQISELKAALGGIGSDFALVVFPYYSPDDPSVGSRYPEYENAIKKLSEDEKIKVIFLSKYFDKVIDKIQIVLNPTDAHPTILANRLAAEGIVSEIDFDSILLKPRVNLGTKTVRLAAGTVLSGLKAILSTYPPNWVYFDRTYGDGIQKLFLQNSQDRKVQSIEDVLKTAKLGRHTGWPGAKIEYTVPLNNLKEFTIPTVIYGYKVVGISQFTVYWRETGALHSIDLSLSDLDINKNDEKIIFKINSENRHSLDLAKIVFDVSVNQFDVDKELVVGIGRTEVLGALTQRSKIISLPQFNYLGKGNGYIWCDGKLRLANISVDNDTVSIGSPSCPNGLPMEIPVMVEGLVDNGDLPLVEYFY